MAVLLFHRVLFEEFIDEVKALSAFGGGADFFDLVRLDGGGFIAEVVADVGEYGSDFVVAQVAEGGHGNGTIKFFTVEFKGAHQTV